MNKRKTIFGLLLLTFCVSVLTACFLTAVPPSKKDILAYVEENYGEKPSVISAVSSEENGSKLTKYTLRINKDNPVEFTVESRLEQSNYGPVGIIKDYHNRDTAAVKNEEAKKLAGAYGCILEIEAAPYASTINLYLNDESLLSQAAQMLCELDELYSFIYTDKCVKIYVKIVLQTKEDKEITETFDFQDFRNIFDAEIIRITAIERFFKVLPEEEVSFSTGTIYKTYSKESLSHINRAIYDAWSKETGYSFEEIYYAPNPLRNNPDYVECTDCYGRGAKGWGKRRAECAGCKGLGFVLKITANSKDIETN